MKMKKHEPKVKPSDDGSPQAVPEETAQQVTKNVCCSYGIHRGNFPVAGMKVKDARAVLKKLIKVADKCLAVINGENVSEDEVIKEGTTLLSFVKPSAKKGAETITINNKKVKMDDKEMDVDNFCGLVSQHTASGMHEQPIPDNVKWIARAGALEVYIVELKPELRWIKWIDESNKEDSEAYQHRKLATPYVVLAVPFLGGQLHSQLELFYRTKPLTSLDDPLYMSNLLNVSTGRVIDGQVGVKTWVCTQYLNLQGVKGPANTLSEIISHIFGGGFNRSSDRNEGNSGFLMYEKHKGADKRVNDVVRWEKESEKDPRFVLEVDWINAGCTPRDLIQFRMNQFKVAEAPKTSMAIGNILLASRMLS